MLHQKDFLINLFASRIWSGSNAPYFKNDIFIFKEVYKRSIYRMKVFIILMLAVAAVYAYSDDDKHQEEYE